MSARLSLTLEKDGFATIQMNNGENRFQTSIIIEWQNMLDKVLENDSIKALVVMGTGKYFSNGIDLEWMSQQQADIVNDFLLRMQNLFCRILVFPLPTVALLNGHAFGGGAFLALACDYRVMQLDKGWLNWPETALGLRFGDALLNITRAKIPPGPVQREVLLYSKRLTGNQAKSLGLVDEVVQESDMVECGKKLIKLAMGKNGFDKKVLQTMKMDIYGKVVDLSKL